MDNKELIERLKNLYADLYSTEPEAEALFQELCHLYKGNNENLMDEYAKLFAPVKTTPESVPGSGNPVDMTQLMIDFSEGYSEFVTRLEGTYRDVLKRRKSAVDLFSKMVSLPFPEARILFMTYYKKMDQEQILKSLFISRSTYYRSKKAALGSLQRMIDKGEQSAI